MAKVKFQMIADSRFDKNISQAIHSLNDKVQTVLQQMDAPYKSFFSEKLTFGDGTEQYRVTYYVDKLPSFTYRQLYTAINSVKPVPYDIIR